MTTKGYLDEKLEYAFSLYDIDKNGYLDKNEIKKVIGAMLNLLDAKNNDLEQITNECFYELCNPDGKITKSNILNYF